MELKAKNGMVDFVLVAGNDKVKNKMLESEARELIAAGPTVERNGQLIVADKFIFGEAEPEQEVKPQEEVKKDVPLSEALNDKPLTPKPRKKRSKK